MSQNSNSQFTVSKCCGSLSSTPPYPHHRPPKIERGGKVLYGECVQPNMTNRMWIYGLSAMNGFSASSPGIFCNTSEAIRTLMVQAAILDAYGCQAKILLCPFGGKVWAGQAKKRTGSLSHRLQEDDSTSGIWMAYKRKIRRLKASNELTVTLSGVLTWEYIASFAPSWGRKMPPIQSKILIAMWKLYR